jgi:MFS family permease
MKIKTSRSLWGIALWMLVLSVMSYIGRTAMSIAGPDIIKEFGLSETQMGTVFSAFLLSYTLLLAPGGWLADRLGPRRALALMMLGASALTAATPLAGRSVVAATLGALPALWLIRFLLGACTAPLYPGCARLTANWFPETGRARVQGLVISGAAIGGAITPVLFTRVIGRFGWRSSFVLIAICAAALACAWYAAIRDEPARRTAARQGSRPEASAEAGVWRRLLADRNLLLLSGGYFAVNYFEYIFFYWIYYYFGQVRGLGRDQSAAYTTILLLAMAAGMPAGGWAADKLIARRGAMAGRRIVCIAGMALSALLLFWGVSVMQTAAVVALLALALGFCASTEGPFWAAAIEIGGEHSGTSSGILNAIGNVGGLLAPVTTPLLAARFGWAGGLYFAGLLSLLGAVAWLFVSPLKSAAPVIVASQPASNA